MDQQVSSAPYRPLRNAASLLSSLSGVEASMLMAAASDIVIAVGDDGKVIDVGYSDPTLSAFAPERWIGQRFGQCVTPESETKADALVSGALGGRVLVGRQVNHPPLDPGSATRPAPDLAVTYRAASIGGGRFMLLGSDMRTVTDLQSRLLRTQIGMDRDIRRLREIETRYRLLFRLADQPLLIVDASSQEIVDANDPAGELFERPARKLNGLTLPALFARPEQPALAAQIATIATKGKADRIKGRIGRNEDLSAFIVEPYREAGGNQLLVRGSRNEDPVATTGRDTIQAVIASMPDGILVVDKSGYIIDANDATLDFVRLSSRDQLIGRRADRWIGGTNVDMQVLLSNLREDGAIRHFASIVRDELGGTTAIDVSASLAQISGEPVFGLVLREAIRSEPEPTETEQPYAPGHFAELVGRVSLRELVRDTADIIEKLCIEEALRQTDNNRASAADVLGLSRQSLYMKLKRYGLEEGPREVGTGPQA